MTTIRNKEGKKEEAREVVKKWLLIAPDDTQFREQYKEFLN